MKNMHDPKDIYVIRKEDLSLPPASSDFFLYENYDLEGWYFDENETNAFWYFGIYEALIESKNILLTWIECITRIDTAAIGTTFLIFDKIAVGALGIGSGQINYSLIVFDALAIGALGIGEASIYYTFLLN